MWVGAGSVSPAIVVRHLGPQLLAVAAGAARRARRRRGREEVSGGVERVGGGRRGGRPPAGAVAGVGRAAGHRAPCSTVDTRVGSLKLREPVKKKVWKIPKIQIKVIKKKTYV